MSLVCRSTGAERIPSLGNVYTSPLSQFLLPWLELKTLLLTKVSTCNFSTPATLFPRQVLSAINAINGRPLYLSQVSGVVC